MAHQLAKSFQSHPKFHPTTPAGAHLTFYKKYMHHFFSLILLISILSGCRSSHHKSSGLTFGDGDSILKAALEKVLADQKTEFAEISWSGSSGNDEFSVRDSLTVKDTNTATIAAKLSTELDKLPSKRGWGSHSSVVSGDSHLMISYKEDNAQFYFDFLLTQKEKDVEILILHKGVQR